MKKFFSKKELRKYGLLLIANLSLAFALIFFINNAGIMTGGLGGISIIANHFFPEFDYITSVVISVLSVVFFFVGWIFKGKNFAAKTLFSSITYPLFIFIFESIFLNVSIVPPAVTELGRDVGLQLLYAVLAGFFIGIGLGLAFKVGGSTGGIDIPAVIISEKFHISIDKVVFAIDAVIIVCGLFALDLVSVIIGVLSNVVYTFVIDKVLVGGQKLLLVQIISSKNEEINEYIQNVLNRGSTFMDVKGGYKKDDHSLLEVAVYRREYSRLIDYIHSIDDKAFVISLDSKEIFGEGFKTYDEETIN